MKRNILAAAVLAAFVAGGATGAIAAEQGTKESAASKGSSASSSGKRDNTAAPPGAPVVVLVPIAIATRPDFSNGCWARLYDSTDFKGNQLSLVGPVDMPNMRTAFGTDWSGQFDSIQVGPKATLTVYDNENYRQKTATFKAGQNVKDLDERMGAFEQIRSVKIACAGGAPVAQGEKGGPSASSSAGSGTSGSGSGFGSKEGGSK